MRNLDLAIMKYIRTHRKRMFINDLINRFGTHAPDIVNQLRGDGYIELRNEDNVMRYRLTPKGFAECGRYQYDRQLKHWEGIIHYILGLLSGLLIAFFTAWLT